MQVDPYFKIRKEIEAYVPACRQEEADQRLMLRYMELFSDLLTRENPIAHLTASSLILNERGERTLLIYHNLYDSWGWTGGHADGETDFLSIALKEAGEESGITEIRPMQKEMISLEILPVWGHEKRGQFVSSHQHLNVTYLLQANEDLPLRIKEDENSGVRWFPLEDMLTVTREEEMKPIYEKLIQKAKLLIK